WRFYLQARSSCPLECACPREAPRCAPGASLVLDACGCCAVCARQLNEDCSRWEPCDRAKGLECNFGASVGETRGICRAKWEGRPCEYNSKIYQNGESFQPNCKHQCTCMDGAVGCVPLCPQELSLPNLGCANPRLVKVTDECCEEWVCDESRETDHTQQLFSKQRGTEESESDLTNRNELITVFKGGLKSLAALRVLPENYLTDSQKCIIQTTDWSQCSKTCGTGISSRVTNNNRECRLVKKTRICEVRPCSHSSFSKLKKGKKCSRIQKSSQEVKFTYAGCSSLKKYRPKYCGSCIDGRCCSPQLTRTIPVKFRCETGETFYKNVMMIESCKCNFNCPHNNDPSYPFYRLVNDIYKVRE
uniref:CCN family member 1 n=1 Tax=Scleropages formosus TaxID=113540 RepID=A0A8C9SLB5_SCLFO